MGINTQANPDGADRRLAPALAATIERVQVQRRSGRRLQRICAQRPPWASKTRDVTPHLKVQRLLRRAACAGCSGDLWSADAGRSADTARAGTGVVEEPGLRVVTAATVLSPWLVEPLPEVSVTCACTCTRTRTAVSQHRHRRSARRSLSARLLLGHLIPFQCNPFASLLYLRCTSCSAHPRHTLGRYRVPAEPITAQHVWRSSASQQGGRSSAAPTGRRLIHTLRFGGLQLARLH